MMGFPFDGRGQVEVVYDENLGEVRTPEIVSQESIGQQKISFHSSGHYKLTTKMGLSNGSIDRATIDGPRLDDIVEPRRMLEILLPKKLPLATTQRTEQSIVLDATPAPHSPLRCTVSCVSFASYKCMDKKGHRFVDTSEVAPEFRTVC